MMISIGLTPAFRFCPRKSQDVYCFLELKISSIMDLEE